MAAHPLGGRQGALDSAPARRRSDPRELGRRPPACVRAVRRRRDWNTRARRANGAARHRRPLPVRPQSDVPRGRRRDRRSSPAPRPARAPRSTRLLSEQSSSPSSAGTRSPRSTVSSARSTTRIGEQCRAGGQDAPGIADEPALPVHPPTPLGQGSAAALRRRATAEPSPGSIRWLEVVRLRARRPKGREKDEPPGCGPRGFVSLAASPPLRRRPGGPDSAAQPTPPNHRRHIWRASEQLGLGASLLGGRTIGAVPG